MNHLSRFLTSFILGLLVLSSLACAVRFSTGTKRVKPSSECAAKQVHNVCQINGNDVATWNHCMAKAEDRCANIAQREKIKEEREAREVASAERAMVRAKANDALEAKRIRLEAEKKAKEEAHRSLMIEKNRAESFRLSCLRKGGPIWAATEGVDSTAENGKFCPAPSAEFLTTWKEASKETTTLALACLETKELPVCEVELAEEFEKDRIARAALAAEEMKEKQAEEKRVKFAKSLDLKALESRSRNLEFSTAGNREETLWFYSRHCSRQTLHRFKALHLWNLRRLGFTKVECEGVVTGWWEAVE